MVITVSEIATLGLNIEFSVELNNVREYVMTEEQDYWTREKPATVKLLEGLVSF